VARWDTVTVKTNNPAEPDALKEVGRMHSKEIAVLDPKQNEMATIGTTFLVSIMNDFDLLGTTFLVSIMNDFDLLPVNNFQYGRHPEADNIGQEVYRRIFDAGYDGCWMGCTLACSHGVKDFVPLTGPYKGVKVYVDGPEYETVAGCGSNVDLRTGHDFSWNRSGLCHGML